MWQELPSLSSYSIRLQCVPGNSFLLGKDAAHELARRGVLLVPSAISCSLSLSCYLLHPLLVGECFIEFTQWWARYKIKVPRPRFTVLTLKSIAVPVRYSVRYFLRSCRINIQHLHNFNYLLNETIKSYKILQFLFT